MDAPANSSDKIFLRYPAGMREKVKARAALHGRSENAEIIRAIQKVLDGDGLIEIILQLLENRNGQRTDGTQL